jgi:hypothetical protein
MWSMAISNGSFNLQEEKEQCDYLRWIDPEWDEMSYAVMLKLMKNKAKAEEDAKQWGGFGKANCELRDIRNEIKIAWQKLQKATAKLKSIGIIGTMSNSHMCCLLYLLFSREWRD